MIEQIQKFSNGYRAVGIEKTMGMEGSGFICTILKDGKVLGESFDYGDGGPVGIRFQNREDEVALLEYAKALFPQYKYELVGIFIGQLVNYEIAVKSLKSKAKTCLLVADETDCDEQGVAKSYSSWKLTDTPENRSKVLAKFPNTVFLNDGLATWETLRKPRK